MHSFDCNRLSQELLGLFENGPTSIRYRLVRRYLLEEGKLERARIRR